MFVYIIQFISWYNVNLDTYPLITKAITTAFIGVVGDTLAQLEQHRRHRENKRRITTTDISNKNNDNGTDNNTKTTQMNNYFHDFHYNKRRCLVNIITNLFITTLIYHYGYEMLEYYLPSSKLLQVGIDCIIFDALFVLLFYISANTIEKNGEEEKEKIQRQQKQSHNRNDNGKENLSHTSMLLAAILATWKVDLYLVPIEYILFGYFPLKVRVLGMNVIDLVWDGIVSFVIHHEEEDESDFVSTKKND